MPISPCLLISKNPMVIQTAYWWVRTVVRFMAFCNCSVRQKGCWRSSVAVALTFATPLTEPRYGGLVLEPNPDRLVVEWSVRLRAGPGGACRSRGSAGIGVVLPTPYSTPATFSVPAGPGHPGPDEAREAVIQGIGPHGWHRQGRQVGDLIDRRAAATWLLIHGSPESVALLTGGGIMTVPLYP